MVPLEVKLQKALKKPLNSKYPLDNQKLFINHCRKNENVVKYTLQNIYMLIKVNKNTKTKSNPNIYIFEPIVIKL